MQDKDGLNVTIRKNVKRKVVTSLHASAYVSRGWGLKKILRSYLWYLESRLTFETIRSCFQIRGPLAWTSLLHSSTQKRLLDFRMIVHNSRSTQFLRGFLIFVGPRCGNCFMSPLLGLEFCKIFAPHLHDWIDHPGPQRHIEIVTVIVIVILRQAARCLLSFEPVTSWIEILRLVCRLVVT